MNQPRINQDFLDVLDALVEVFFIGREAMIKNKKALGRMKDLADVEALEGDSGPKRPGRE